MKNLASTITLSILLLISACNEQQKKADVNVADTSQKTTEKIKQNKPIADAATIMARKQVPILCYHQIRDWAGSDSKMARDYIVPVQAFKEHLKILADSGYHTVLPDQLYNYLAFGDALPEKPVMLTFDDTDDDQFDIAAPEMKKYGFKGVFFIMTVPLNRPRYMSRDQIKQLSDEGHEIESHTWDHHKFTGYKEEKDWLTQIDKPKKQIEELTGKPAEYFAYPYGLWNKQGIPELKKRGVKAAYQLSTRRDPDEPLFTIRRIIASGFWSANTMYKSMIASFNHN